MVSKRHGKSRETKQPVRAPSKSADQAQPSTTPAATSSTRRPRNGTASAITWFAVGGLLTLGLACRPAWLWPVWPIAGSTVNWPAGQEVFPEFRAVLSVLWSTSAIFFLLVPLATWSLPRRVLQSELPGGAPRSAVESAGYWLMWLALAVFAATFFLPGIPLPLACPAQPAGAVWWRSATGNAAVTCWLSAVIVVWLAAVLASAGRLGQFFEPRPSLKSPPRTPRAWGIALGAAAQLLVYPFLAALACGWLLDLLCGTEVFVPAGMMTDDVQASTGGGPSPLWLFLFAVVAWPTVLVCCVPVAGLIAPLFTRRALPREESQRAAAAEDSAPADIPIPAEERPTIADPWAARGLLVAACSFLTGIAVTGLAARYRSPGGYPRLAEMGLSSWPAAAGVAVLVVSSFCLYRASIGRQESLAAGSWRWITAAAFLAALCGALAASQLRSLARQGLHPARAERLIYHQADLNYASAVRIRLQQIRSSLDVKAANEGVLSADDQALRDLCNRLLTTLVNPTEKEVAKNGDGDAIAALAGVVASRSDPRAGKLVFAGTDAELLALRAAMLARSQDLQLPRVVPGGRPWVGIRYLLDSVLLAYLLVLLTLLAHAISTPRSSLRLARLRLLAPFWHLATVFSVFCFVAG